LDQASTTVSGTEVTINTADLPLAVTAVADGGWIVFKFAAPVTLAAATLYSVKGKTSSASMVNLHTSSGTNWARMLRTTTQQAPAAADDMHIAGEYTGAGASNSFVVTMNQTAATDYGSAPSGVNSLITPGVGISSKGTLSWDSSSAANPLLRLSSSLVVYNGGTLNIGTVGTPIPRDSRAILEFDQLSVDGDYGLIVRNGGTFNGQGLSRTSGKNIVSCKLAADAPSVTSILLGTVSNSNVTNTAVGALGHDGVSRIANNVADTAANVVHSMAWTTATVTNVTQVFSIWLARGTGTNNRYCRIQLAIASGGAPTNGCYVDVDLQAVTVGTPGVFGNGTATSAAITAAGTGFIVTLIGKVSSTASQAVASVILSNAPGTITYTGDATNNIIYHSPQLFTTSSQPSADLTVDTDTGWLAGDVIAVAPTGRVSTEGESFALASNAGASTLTPTVTSAFNHSGTSPTQAEIILLTRNVVIRSTTSTLMAYVSILGGGIVDLDWVEFYWMGEGVQPKRGIEIGFSTVTNVLPVNTDIRNCSLHNFEDNGLTTLTSSGPITNLTIAYNTMWNLGTNSVQLGVNVGIQQTNWTFDHNILIRIFSGTGIFVADAGGTFTNNTVAGAASVGITIAENGGVLGTFSNNVAHSCSSNGVGISGVNLQGSIGALTVWRNSTTGLLFNSAPVDLVITDLVCFGNFNNNIAIGGSTSVTFINPIVNGESVYNTTNGFQFSTFCSVTIINGSFGVPSGTKTAHTQDFSFSAASDAYVNLYNTILASPIEVAPASVGINMSERGYCSSQKNDQGAGSHITWMKNGKVESDSTIYHTASPSMRMSPTMAPTLITASAPVTSGSSVIPTVQNYFFDWISVGDWLIVGSGFPTGAKIASLNAGAGTITMDRYSVNTAASPNINIWEGKLASALPGKGFQIAADASQTFTVGVWVRRQQDNLISYSSDYTQAGWTTNASTATTGQSDPLGGSNATRYLETTESAAHSLGRVSLPVQAGLAHCLSIYLKSVGGRQWFRFSETGVNSWFDLVNGVAGTVNAAHNVSLTDVGSGWYRVQILFAPPNNTTSITIAGASADNNNGSYAGNTSMGFVSFGWQMESIVTTPSPYQATGASAIAGYVGNQPRLIQRANPAIGIANDVVLDTMTVSNGTWEQLTGTTTAPIGDVGVVEIYVDCDGMGGWINIDDFSVS